MQTSIMRRPLSDTPLMREVSRCLEKIRNAPIRQQTTIIQTMVKDGDYAVLSDLIVFRTSEERAAVGVVLPDGNTRRLTPQSVSLADAASCAAMQIVTARYMYGDAELLLVYENLAGEKVARQQQLL